MTHSKAPRRFDLPGFKQLDMEVPNITSHRIEVRCRKTSQGKSPICKRLDVKGGTKNEIRRL